MCIIWHLGLHLGQASRCLRIYCGPQQSSDVLSKVILKVEDYIQVTPLWNVAFQGKGRLTN